MQADARLCGEVVVQFWGIEQHGIAAAQRIFNPLDQIKTIQEVETVICKVKKFDTRLTKNWLSC